MNIQKKLYDRLPSKIIKVNQIKIDELIDLISNREVHFLNIDIEGNEIYALKSLNFKKYNPKLICVEIHNNNTSGRNNKNYFKSKSIYKFLIKKGYKFIWKNEFSFIFKRK